jgi:hypothetical protein
MKTTNNLPKYWVVQCNTRNPNWKKVINYLHKVHGEIWVGLTDGAYYGYDGGLSCWNGTNVYNNISEFRNSPVVLTIEEFVEMTEGNIIPEYVECTESASDGFTVGRIYNFPNPIDNQLNKRYIDILNGGMWTFKPSTKKAFDKQQQKPKETMKTITHTQAQQIIDIACSKWKNELFDHWGKNIVLKHNIVITDEEYQRMRKACTHEQHQLFDEIFGIESNFKVGDWVYVIDGGSGAKGANDKVGQITNESSNNGLLSSELGINISIGENVWKVSPRAELRLATENELKPKFKIGDWVYAEKNNADDWRDDAKYIPTFQIKEMSNCGGYARPEAGKTTGIHVDNLRLATEEEIQKAISIPIPKGTPCLVRDNDDFAWKFAYSSGDGRFETGANNFKWKQVKVLDMKDLPKF